MNQVELRIVENEIKKIAEFPGFGCVLVKIENGEIVFVEPTPKYKLVRDSKALDKPKL